jgi:hypothetical protein
MHIASIASYPSVDSLPMMAPHAIAATQANNSSTNSVQPPNASSSSSAQQPVDLNDQVLLRKIQAWLLERDRQLIPVQIKGSRATAASSVGNSQSQLQPQASPSGLSSPDPRGADRNATAAVCVVCNTRKVNSLCSNAACKSCCSSHGKWACSVHKAPVGVNKPPKPMSNSDAVAAVATSTAPEASFEGNGDSASANGLNAGLLQLLGNIHVPCPFCGKEVSFQIAFLRQHLHACKAGFFQSFTSADSMTIQQLYELAWGMGQPGKALPDSYQQVRTLLKAQEDLQTAEGKKARLRARSSGGMTPSVGGAVSSQPSSTGASSQTQPSAQQGANSLSILHSRVSAALQQFKPRVNLVALPLPRDTPEFKPVTYSSYRELADRASQTPLFDERDLEAASKRYEESVSMLNLLFSSSIPLEDEDTIPAEAKPIILQMADYIGKNPSEAVLQISQRTEATKREILDLKTRIETGYTQTTESIRDYVGIFQGLLKIDNTADRQTVVERYTQLNGRYWLTSISAGQARKRSRQDTSLFTEDDGVEAKKPKLVQM